MKLLRLVVCPIRTAIAITIYAIGYLTLVVLLVLWVAYEAIGAVVDWAFDGME